MSLENLKTIPQEMAIKLCDEICEDNRGKWYTFNGLWCWGCRTFSKGGPTGRCFASVAGNLGCTQVNKRWAAILEKWQPR